MPGATGHRGFSLAWWWQAGRRRPLLWIAPLLTCAGVAVALTALHTPTYEATAKVFLASKNEASRFDPQTGLPQNRTRAIEGQARLMTGPDVQARVRKVLGLAPPATAVADGLSDVVAVRATSSDARQAADIANAYAYAYLDLLRTNTVESLLVAADQTEGQLSAVQAQLQALGPSPADNNNDPSSGLRQNLATQRDSLAKQLDDLQLGASIGSGGASLLSAAAPPTSPVAPKPAVTLILALMAGGVLGAVAVAVAEYFDDSVQDADDLTAAGSGLSLLARVPAVTGRSGDRAPTIISISEPGSPAAESYRSLRTALRFLTMGAAAEVIQVTSPSPGDGKSTTAVNLATAMAAAGQRVCLVDGDLRRPQVARFCRLPDAVGLSNVIIGESTVAAAVQPVAEMPRLSILASGPIPPYPAELLSSARTGTTLDQLRAMFDVVVVDSPPLLAVTDAAVISQHVDVVLLVVAEGVTARRAMVRAVEVLDQVGAPAPGLVLNRARSAPSTMPTERRSTRRPPSGNVAAKSNLERREAVTAP